MNKKRTRNIGKTKYAIFIHLAALLMLVSNFEAVARVTSKSTKGINVSLTKNELTPEIAIYTPAPITHETDSANPKKSNVFTAVEEMPKYPGGDQELLKYLAANLKYPVEAQQNKIEGKVYIRFIVTEDGDIDKATVMKSLNKECDEEALRVIKGMPKWEPGKQNGVNASVYYVIPFHFSLNKNKTITTENTLAKNGAPEEPYPYTTVQEKPRFPGGEYALMQLIFKNLKYPIISRENGVKGKVYVRFTITEDGTVKNPKIIRPLDDYCNQEVIRIIRIIPKWIPGKQNGVNVPVYIDLPITFEIN